MELIEELVGVALLGEGDLTVVLRSVVVEICIDTGLLGSPFVLVFVVVAHRHGMTPLGTLLYINLTLAGVQVHAGCHVGVKHVIEASCRLSMELTRRNAAVAVAAGVGLSGLASVVTREEGDYQFRRGGRVATDEPLVADTDVSPQRGYPSQYHALLTDETDAERVRWEYFAEADGPRVEQFRDVDFDAGFLVIVGRVLPDTKKLQSGPTSFDGREMIATYGVAPRTSASDAITVQSVVEYWAYTTAEARPPTNLVVQYRFDQKSG